jgi:hypothetical protein
MELNQVYFKTSKGLEEIQNRTYKLAASLRRLLIMVDGRSTAAEMIQRLTTLGDVAIALGELEAGGFIASGASVEASAGSRVSMPPPNPVTIRPPAAPAGARATPTQGPAPVVNRTPALSEGAIMQDIWGGETSAASSPAQPLAQSGQPAFNLDKAKSFVRFTLLGAMGPAAGRRVERIEATHSAEELRVELDAIRDMLPKVLSKRQAELIWRQLEPIMLSLSQPPL